MDAAILSLWNDGVQGRDTVLKHNNKVHYYKAIHIMDGCLPCHGHTDTDIGAENLALLRSLYPAGKAVNYQSGDLRGAWKLVWDN
mgnify:CR=1 FL=1